MMPFEVTVLGSSSSIPVAGRNLSSQLLNISGRYFLIDCGEGTQMQLRKNKLKIQRINNIFISHLHGDHYFGLVGLLSTMNLLGRKNELNIYAPADLKKIIDLQMQCAEANFKYKINFYNLNFQHSEIIFEDDIITVETIILKHRLPCCGFLFKEKTKPKNLLVKAIAAYGIPVESRQKIKLGEDYITPKGNIIKNELLTSPPQQLRIYAYCSDTAYNESMIEQIKGTDLLYHEATFLHEHEDRAKETMHSTAAQAASIAKKAEVKKLLIGHFSARYKDTQPLLDEAAAIFKNTMLSLDNKKYEV